MICLQLQGKIMFNEKTLDGPRGRILFDGMIDIVDMSRLQKAFNVIFKKCRRDRVMNECDRIVSQCTLLYYRIV